MNRVRNTLGVVVGVAAAGATMFALWLDGFIVSRRK